jgi:hypothetical protein
LRQSDAAKEIIFAERTQFGGRRFFEVPISSATKDLAQARLWLGVVGSFRHEMLAAGASTLFPARIGDAVGAEWA